MPNNETWEAEFDREFIQDGGVIEEYRPHHIKNFIREQITLARREEAKKWESAMNKDSYYMTVGGRMVKVVSVEVVLQALSPTSITRNEEKE